MYHVLIAWITATGIAASAVPMATKSAKECISYSQQEGDSSIDMTLSNSCQAEFDCKLEWRLICTDLKGKKTKTNNDRQFVLAIHGRQEVTADASSCGYGSWQIADVTWQCKVHDVEAPVE